MNFKVLMIGAGRIGFRHFQGLLKSQTTLDLTVLDPSQEALLRCEEEFRSENSAHTLKTVKDFENLSSSYHAMIITTCSDIRYELVTKFFEISSAKFVVLEKVPFQTKDEYLNIGKLFRSRDVYAVVHCPRPSFASYQALKQSLSSNEKILNFTARGSHWGMACNSLHFLDLINFLSPSSNWQVSGAELDPGFINAKRDGFYEVNGKIQFENDRGVRGDLICFEEGPLTSIQILTNKRNIIIDESKQILLEIGVGTQQFKMNNVSELTGKYIDQYVLTGNCDLTNYEDFLCFGLPFMDVIQQHLKKNGLEFTRCPIT